MVTIRPQRAPALGDQLAEVLRDRIIRRQLHPGDRLVEDALASEYDVSRGPVRDALRQLENQGLVESRRRGYFVLGLSQSDINDLYELRESIEVLAIVKAAERAQPDQLLQVESAVNDMHACADRSDAAGFAAADVRFHELIYEASGNRRLLDVWDSYAPVFASLIRLTVGEDRDLHPSATDHGRLLELMAKEDHEALRQGLRDHLEGARNRMVKAVAILESSDDDQQATVGTE